MSRVRAAIVAICLLLATACGTLPELAPTDRGEYAQVSLAPAALAGANLAHPGRIGAERLRQALAMLHYEEEGALRRSRQTPVFGPDELDDLVPRLATALATAGPDQRVVFVSLAPGASATSGARKTEGTLFIESGGQLNIAFAGVRHLLTVDDDFTRFREPSLGDPLRVTRSLIRLQPEPGLIELRRQDSGDPYPLWVRLDPTRVNRATSPAGARPARADAQRSEAPPAPASTRAPEDEDKAEKQPGPAHSADSDSLTPAQIRERLAFLKSLHDDGLISDQEYELERQRALRRLD